MKTRIILFALVAIAATACDQGAVKLDVTPQELIITACQEGSDIAKTGLVDGGTQVGWEYGDNIKVFYDGNGAQFSPIITVRDDHKQEDIAALHPVVNFSGRLDNVPAGGNLPQPLWGLYPYRSDATSDGSSVTTTLPDDQVGMPGSFFKRTQITLACANSIILPFYNVTGGIRFKVTRSDIKSVTLESNNGEALAGTVKIAFEGGVPKVKSVTDGSSSIRLTAPRAGTFKTGTWYYIVTLPGKLSGGFKLSFRTDTEAGVANVSSPVTISRGTFGSMDKVDQNVAFSRETAASLLPEIHDGDVVLATNPQVEKFLTEVSYPERDYSYSKLLDYPPVAPGQADLPPVYVIKWAANPDAGELTARLVDGDWSKEVNLAAGSGFLEVTNLRPNASYTYEVRSAGNAVLAGGSFTTTGHLHQLYFKDKVRNCRDLGGWKTKDGTKTVKYRKIYRGGRLQWAVPHTGWTEEATLSEEGLADVLAEGIKAQLELRNSNDAISATALGDGYEFCAPLIPEGYSYMIRPEGYKGEDLRPKTRQCIQFIIDCIKADKPVYFHCSLGRDRTGTIAMLVLGILGVNEGDISKEYELTQFSPHYWGVSDGEKTIMTRMSDYHSAANYIWEHHTTGTQTFAQGVENFFLSIGISQSDIESFRNLMLE